MPTGHIRHYDSSSQAIIKPPKTTFHIHKEHLGHNTHRFPSKVIETTRWLPKNPNCWIAQHPCKCPPSPPPPQTDVEDMIDSRHKVCKWANGPRKLARSFIQLPYLMFSYPIGARPESFWHTSHDNLPEPGWGTLLQDYPETGFSFLLSGLVFGLSWGCS